MSAVKIAPYGRICGGRSDLRVYFGNGKTWERARWTNDMQGPAGAMVLPRGESPVAYTWPVRGRAVTAICIGAAPPSMDKQLAGVLLGYGARTVICVTDEGIRRYE